MEGFVPLSWGRTLSNASGWEICIFSIYLFFNHLYQHELINTNFILWVITQYYFVSQAVPSLAIGSSFSCNMCPFDITSTIFFFLSISLFAGTTRCSQLIWICITSYKINFFYLYRSLLKIAGWVPTHSRPNCGPRGWSSEESHPKDSGKAEVRREEPDINFSFFTILLQTVLLSRDHSASLNSVNFCFLAVWGLLMTRRLL